MVPANPSTVAVPLREDEQGVIRVGGTRIPLETIIHQYQRGASPEGIVAAFSALSLSDVYAVIAYYLQNKSAVDAYVRDAEAEAARIRRESEEQQPELAGLRERLMARLQDKTEAE
jgi:uncharacterized protein (DUF433 family)